MAYTTIDKPSDYFNTVLYTGNNGSQTVTGLDFQPDWVWIKDRDGTERHCLTDSVRGVLQELRSNETAAESDRSGGTPGIGGVSAFNSNGFSLVHDDGYNDNNSLQVSWNWLASNSTASNTDGTITSTVSANQTAGFSIVSWTGNENASSTVGHGLGSDLGMIIIKNRIDAEHWEVWHKNLTSTSDYRLLLSGTIAENNNTAFFSEAPTSTVFTPGSNNAINGSGDSMIAYCFAEKKGYSKFGKYTGNGNADGTFIYTGFKPAFFLSKRTDAIKDWHIIDNKRDIDNPTQTILYPNANFAEGTPTGVDFLSNGIKTRNSDVFINGSGATYIYMAFAENPFVTSSGVPTTAR